jgi:hypothetical protein
MPVYHSKLHLKKNLKTPKASSESSSHTLSTTPLESQSNQEKNSLKKSLFHVYQRLLPANIWLRRILLCLLALVLIVTGSMYGIAQWYIASNRSQPLVMGASFIPSYASYLGVDPQKTLDAMLGIGIKHLRLVSYWNEIQPADTSTYDYSQLDWQFRKAEAAGAKITLAIGLRQPRWPECHMPDWAMSQPVNVWQPKLERFIESTMLRYKSSPALDSYQLENEYFNRVFGMCTNFDRSRLKQEYAVAKRSDPFHPIIISRSNNGVGIPLYDPKPDEYGISIYKRVWDSGVTKRYLEYPFPAWYYGFLAGAQKINDGRNMVIHEMQAEAWAPNGKSILDISLAEQNKSLDAKRFAGRFDFAKATGMRSFDMWGAEYWYYRKEVLKDPSLWNVAKSEYAKTE